MQINSKNYQLLMTLFLVLTCAILLVIYLYWQELLTISQHWQREFHQQLTQFLTQVSARPWQTGSLLTGLSLLYGILHSAGPGHGKFIITTYLATQPSKLKKSLYLTLFSAIMQGIVAILLVTVLLIVFNLSTQQLRTSEYWLEFASYALVVIIGLLLCYRALKKIRGIYKQIKASQIKPQIIKIKSISATNHSNSLLLNQLENDSCSHGHSCDCGHRHMPTLEELGQSKHWYSDLAIIISIGMRPCSGALLVLLFSYVIGVYGWGIVATIAMSIGTAITTSCFALLVYFARKIAEQLAKKQLNHAHYRLMLISYFIAIIGGILFIAMGILLIAGLDMQAATVVTNPLLR